MFRGWISLLPGFFAAVGLLAAETKVSVVSQSTLEGMSLDVPILLDATEDITAVQFDLTFNPNRLAAGAAVLPQSLEGFIVRSRLLEPGVIRVVFYSNANLPVPSTVFVKVPFTVFDGVPRGANPLTLENVVPSSVAATLPDPLDVVSGNIIVGPTGAVSLGSVIFSPDGAFRIELSGVLDLRFTVEASENLHDWKPLLTATATTDTFEFVDPDAANFSRRFYRVRHVKSP